MFVLSAKLTFYIAHGTSLKDKRRVRQSIIEKTRRKFNAAIAEIDTQDILQTLTIGVAVVSADAAHRQSYLRAVIRFMEEQAEAELMSADFDH